jgi:hypothetical protein
MDMGLKFLWAIGFALIVAAGVAGITLWPGNYPLPACLNLLAGVFMGAAMMLEHRGASR